MERKNAHQPADLLRLDFQFQLAPQDRPEDKELLDLLKWKFLGKMDERVLFEDDELSRLHHIGSSESLGEEFQYFDSEGSDSAEQGKIGSINSRKERKVF